MSASEFFAVQIKAGMRHISPNDAGLPLGRPRKRDTTMSTITYPTNEEMARIERAARAYRAQVVRSGFRAAGHGIASAWRALAAALHRPSAA